MGRFVSIIIAVKNNNPFLEECVRHCLANTYSDFEIIILPDTKCVGYDDKRISIIPTGTVLPAEKRDIGSKHAKGEILAFLDDDTFPAELWLYNAVTLFQDETVACVCGPAVTPQNEPLRQKASGGVYESWIVSGPARFRYVPRAARFTDDFPSCNFFIRKNVFNEIGGFKTKFWPGEDTILCLEVVHALKKKILYDPTVKVFHHRRKLFGEHLKQIRNYALHRGYFVKRFPKTSLKLGYFLPSLLVLGLAFSLIAGFIFGGIFWLPLYFYLLAALILSFQSPILLFFLIFLGIISTHCVYGIFFIKGLFVRKLKEE